MGINLIKKRNINLGDIKSSSQLKKGRRRILNKDTLVVVNIFLFMLTCLIAVGFILFYWKVLNESKKAQDEARYFKNELNLLTLEQEGYVELAGKTNLLKKNILTDNLQADVYDKMKAVFDSLRDNYEFQSIFYDGNNFTYSFITDDYDSAAMFINSIKVSEELKKLFGSFEYQRSNYNSESGRVVTSIKFSVKSKI
ncbi:hypothetical protein IPJ91_00875 [bacterium]|nr:MAG: hypothetical protein IPJ91_00875 [bacterium]